ncbi:MAG: single-stranded DNA-binding protein, partial [Desulfobacterales bacterium]|nr:single-stranded DNA-binding protein [Desulfobacterales bacterium]
MSQDINRVIQVGRLTKNAELSYTTTGFALTKMSIAVNRRKKQGDQWVDEANFFDVVIWGKRGEALQNYLVKGQQIAIEGELKQERWEKDGVKRSKVTIEASNIQLLGGKKDQQPQQN